jgi:hypothetical protein
MRTSKTNRRGQDVQLREGFASVMGSSAKVLVEGKEVEGGQVLSALDDLIAAAQATDAAKAAYHQAVAREAALLVEAHPLLSGVRRLLGAMLAPEQLARCGLAPRKPPRPLSANERTAATAKLRATRQANGTRGARQAREEEAKAFLTATFAHEPPKVG